MKVYAIVPFKYDRPDYQLDRGEIFHTKDFANDVRLHGLGYYGEFDPNVHKTIKCDNCGRAFVSEDFYIGHKRKRDGCMSKEQEINKHEYSKLIGQDESKVKIDKAEPILPPPASL